MSQLGVIGLKGKKMFSTGDTKIWHQMLQGDRGDNVPGLKGYGPKKSYQLLHKAQSSEEMIEIVKEEYRKVHGTVTGMILFQENLKLVYMLKNASIPIPEPIQCKVHLPELPF